LLLKVLRHIVLKTKYPGSDFEAAIGIEG